MTLSELEPLRGRPGASYVVHNEEIFATVCQIELSDALACRGSDFMPWSLRGGSRTRHEEVAVFRSTAVPPPGV